MAGYDALMAAPSVLRDVFHALRSRMGEEDDGIVYERPGERVDVFVYRPKPSTPMTRFATIGMAARPQPRSGARVELQLTRRGALSSDAERAITLQLANLASHPWAMNSDFDWGHVLGLNRPFPTFGASSAVFLAGPFTNDGWGWIDTGEGKVKIINVVPMTEGERERARSMNPIAFLQELMANVDIFADRAGPQSPSGPGRYANAERRAIRAAFEATCGDLENGVEPVHIESRAARQNVVRGEVRYMNDVLDVRYRILDASLDDADARRLLLVAYLDVFTDHYWRKENVSRYQTLSLRMTNADTGATSTTRYPDPE